MATKSLTFDLYGRDRTASKAIKGVGNEAQTAGMRFKGLGAVAGVALAAVGAAAVGFGVDSVKAFAEAEEAQNRLNFAYEKFPKLTDVSIEALRDLNTELMNKTRFDDDALAIGQAQLAQYGLTGKQLMELTPLLADFAGKTGKDLPTAAEALGKALLGNGRALKDVGIDFQDTGSVAGNFDSIVEGLRGQVGGFAEESATTTAGKLDILRNKFGEVQEKVGEKLNPAIDTLLGLMSDQATVDAFASTVGDAAAELADVSGMIDDITRAVEALKNIGNAEERFNWADDQMKRGGVVGEYLKWANEVGEGLQEWWAGLTTDQENWANDFNTNWQHTWGQAKTETDSGMDGVRGGMGGGMSAMSGDLSVFEDATRTGWGGLWSDVDGTTRSGLGTVDASTGLGLGTIGTTLAGMNPKARAAFVAAWLSAQAATGTGWAGVDGRTRSGMSTVGGTLSGFRGVVQGPFAGSSSWLVSAGQNIVQGLVGGIASMVGNAAAAAATLAANVVTGAKAALGIKSPSRVFREIGEFVGQGFELGISDMQPLVAASVNAMVAAPRVTTAIGGGSSPSTMILRVGEREFTAYVEEKADGRIASAGRQQKVALENGNGRRR